MSIRKTTPTIMCLALAALAAPLASSADVIAYNSFETEDINSPIGELPYVTNVNPGVITSAAAQIPANAADAYFATDGFNDYFVIVRPGEFSLIASSNPSSSGADGQFELTAEDTAQDGMPGICTLTFDPVSLNGFDNVQVKVLVAATEAANFETGDVVRLEYIADGGGTTLLGQFRGDGAGRLANDSDLDGTGDGAPIGLAYQEFTFDVPAGIIDFQLVLDVDVDGNEEIFVDNIRIEGTPGIVNDPVASVLQPALDFRALDPLEVVDLVVDISNPGATQTLTILPASGISGADASSFSIVDALPKNIGPGASDTVTVRMTAPASGGFRVADATLNLVTNDNVTPNRDVPLGGRVRTGASAVVEVNGVQNPPTSFASISSATAYLDANHEGDAWTINVTTDGPITEAASIVYATFAYGGVTVNGDADGNGTPVTIITDASAAGSQANFVVPGGNYCQFYVGGDELAYTFRDLILQPKFIAENTSMDATVGASGGVRGFIIEDYDEGGTTNGKTINFENVTIGGSLAGDVLAADPNTNQYTLVTRYSRGVNVFSSGTSELDGPVESTINATNLRMFNLELEGMVFGGDATTCNIGPGCVFAWTGESAFLVSGANQSTFSMDGSPSARILVRGAGQVDVDEEGIDVVGGASETTEFRWSNMRWVDVVENGAESEMGMHAGPELMEFVRFGRNDLANDDADGSDTGVRYGYIMQIPGASTTRVMRNVTVHDSQNPAGVQYGLNFTGRPTGLTFDVSDMIVSGSGDQGFFLRDGGESTMNLSTSAAVTSGPDALSADFVGVFDGSPGNFTLNQSGVISADPQYVTTTYDYFDSVDYLRPSNAAYSTAGAGGEPLTGGAGDPTASIDNWTMMAY